MPPADSYPKLTAEMLGTPMRLAADYMLAEGPIWDHCQKKMLFTDVNTQTIHTIEAGDMIGVFKMDTNYVNGQAFDQNGFLVQAEMGGRAGGKITRMGKDGMMSVVIDKNPMGGNLNTTDDLIVRSDGTIYFSDPVIAHGDNPTSSLSAKPLYRLPPGATSPVQQAMMSLPNGVDLSPDEKTLYVAEFLGGVVSKFDVGPDGALTGEKTFAGGLSNPDSMCLDAAGNLYVGVSQGLAVISPDGMKIKTITMSTNKGVTNCEFGGEDGKTMYITAWQSLWKLDKMPIPGLAWTVNKQRQKCM